ncbi:hypothetical protein ACEPAH_6191 [Sanghuangporus vaninii]
MTVSSSNPAVYQPLPQAPDVSDDIIDEEEVTELESVESPHIDKRIWWIHFIFGCAVLLPWNVLVTATPYFYSQLSGSSLRSSFSSYLSITFTVANFLFLAHATLTSHQSSPSRRISVSTALLAVLVGLLTLSTTTSFSPGLFFSFVLLNGILQAGAGSYLQTAVVAVASLFGSATMQAVMAGQAFVGVVVSAVQLLSAIASVRASASARAANVEYDEGAAEARAAALSFGLSTLFLCVTIGTQLWLVGMPEYKAVMRPTEHAKRDDQSTHNEILQEKGRILRVAKANYEFEIAVCYVFAVTLAVFPPITASVQPTDPTSFHPLIFTAIHFLLFNLGDLAGRYLCSVPRLLTWSSRRLLILSLARTLFIPLFLLCNIQRPSSPLPVPEVPANVTTTINISRSSIGSNTFFFLLLLFFGLSNGYVSSMCMIAAPSATHNPRLRGKREDVDIAATVASFCLVGGLALGAAASFVVRAQVCRCNPFVE